MTGKNSTVAVIDPDHVVRARLARALGGLDVDVDTYPCAETFLAGLNPNHCDCVVSETLLPGISGIELLKRLLVLEKPIPTILVTQQSDIELAVHAMRTGAVDFMEKPVTEAVLVGLVRNLLSTEESAN